MIHTGLCRLTKFTYGINNSVQTTLCFEISLLVFNVLFKFFFHHLRRPHLKILGHGEDNSAGDNERSKNERKTEEEMGRYHQGMDGMGFEIP